MSTPHANIDFKKKTKKNAEFLLCLGGNNVTSVFWAFFLFFFFFFFLFLIFNNQN